jgi:predicted Zn-dependent protease
MPLSNKENLEVPKDSILLNIAKLQIDLNKKKEAIKTLKTLIKDFPNSSMVNKYGRYGMTVASDGEAKVLLKKVEDSLDTNEDTTEKK